MRRDEESERATKATGARPALDNRQKFPIIKRTGVYTGNQFRIWPRRLRGIRRARERLVRNTQHWSSVRCRWFLQKEIRLSCSWYFLHRPNLRWLCDNYAMLILWQRCITFTSSVQLICQLHVNYKTFLCQSKMIDW